MHSTSSTKARCSRRVSKVRPTRSSTTNIRPRTLQSVQRHLIHFSSINTQNISKNLSSKPNAQLHKTPQNSSPSRVVRQGQQPKLCGHRTHLQDVPSNSPSFFLTERPLHFPSDAIASPSALVYIPHSESPSLDCTEPLSVSSSRPKAGEFQWADNQSKPILLLQGIPQPSRTFQNKTLSQQQMDDYLTLLHVEAPSELWHAGTSPTRDKHFQERTYQYHAAAESAFLTQKSILLFNFESRRRLRTLLQTVMPDNYSISFKNLSIEQYRDFCQLMDRFHKYLIFIAQMYNPRVITEDQVVRLSQLKRQAQRGSPPLSTEERLEIHSLEKLSAIGRVRNHWRTQFESTPQSLGLRDLCHSFRRYVAALQKKNCRPVPHAFITQLLEDSTVRLDNNDKSISFDAFNWSLQIPSNHPARGLAHEQMQLPIMYTPPQPNEQWNVPFSHLSENHLTELSDISDRPVSVQAKLQSLPQLDRIISPEKRLVWRDFQQQLQSGSTLSRHDMELYSQLNKAMEIYSAGETWRHSRSTILYNFCTSEEYISFIQSVNQFAFDIRSAEETATIKSVTGVALKFMPHVYSQLISQKSIEQIITSTLHILNHFATIFDTPAQMKFITKTIHSPNIPTKIITQYLQLSKLLHGLRLDDSIQDTPQNPAIERTHRTLLQMWMFFQNIIHDKATFAYLNSTTATHFDRYGLLSFSRLLQYIELISVTNSFFYQDTNVITKLREQVYNVYQSSFEVLSKQRRHQTNISIVSQSLEQQRQSESKFIQFQHHLDRCLSVQDRLQLFIQRHMDNEQQYNIIHTPIPLGLQTNLYRPMINTAIPDFITHSIPPDRVEAYEKSAQALSAWLQAECALPSITRILYAESLQYFLLQFSQIHRKRNSNNSKSKTKLTTTQIENDASTTTTTTTTDTTTTTTTDTTIDTAVAHLTTDTDPSVVTTPQPPPPQTEQLTKRVLTKVAKILSNTELIKVLYTNRLACQSYLQSMYEYSALRSMPLGDVTRFFTLRDKPKLTKKQRKEYNILWALYQPYSLVEGIYTTIDSTRLEFQQQALDHYTPISPLGLTKTTSPITKFDNNHLKQQQLQFERHLQRLHQNRAVRVAVQELGKEVLLFDDDDDEEKEEKQQQQPLNEKQSQQQRKSKGPISTSLKSVLSFLQSECNTAMTPSQRKDLFETIHKYFEPGPGTSYVPKSSHIALENQNMGHIEALEAKHTLDNIHFLETKLFQYLPAKHEFQLYQDDKFGLTAPQSELLLSYLKRFDDFVSLAAMHLFHIDGGQISAGPHFPQVSPREAVLNPLQYCLTQHEQLLFQQLEYTWNHSVTNFHDKSSSLKLRHKITNMLISPEDLSRLRALELELVLITPKYATPQQTDEFIQLMQQHGNSQYHFDRFMPPDSSLSFQPVSNYALPSRETVYQISALLETHSSRLSQFKRLPLESPGDPIVLQ